MTLKVSKLAWKRSKKHMSREHPSLYEVLGELVSSEQPIEEGDIFQASQNIMKEKHRALRVLQGEEERTNFTEEEAQQFQPIDEEKPTEADKLQIKHACTQLVCLLVHKTKGETQLQVTEWFQTTNAWEAWRKLNLQSSSEPRSELRSQLCDSRCCDTFAWLRHHNQGSLENMILSMSLSIQQETEPSLCIWEGIFT